MNIIVFCYFIKKYTKKFLIFRSQKKNNSIKEIKLK